MQAWVAAHVTLAIALRMMGEGLRYVSSTRGAAGLMQSIIKEAHKQLIEVGKRPLGCMLHWGRPQSQERSGQRCSFIGTTAAVCQVLLLPALQCNAAHVLLRGPCRCHAHRLTGN